MTRFSKRLLIWTIGFLLLIAFYFSDNVLGYYRFKKMCEKDAGLHVYQPLRRNLGWFVPEGRIEAAGFPLDFDGVAFVRYRNETDGRLYDVYRSSKSRIGDSGYLEKLANKNNEVIYRFEVRTIPELTNEQRMGAQHFEVIDMETAQLAVRYTRLGYRKFDTDKTVFGAPSGEECPEDVSTVDPRTGKRVASKIELAFSSAFAN
jgi:hypothetical protein